MNARPILFSAPMVRALLEGRKSQTRRTNGLGYVNNNPVGWTATCSGGEWCFRADGYEHRTICPYGKPGDLLWVREACVNWRADDVWKTRWLREADSSECSTFSRREKPGRRASMHMPRRDSRLTLRLTDVRVQRLQEISTADAEAEGIELWPKGRQIVAVNAYTSLWNQINGAGSWAANPWVWALTFEVIKANVDDVLRDRKEAA